jgi:hypothetical protein
MNQPNLSLNVWSIVRSILEIGWPALLVALVSVVAIRLLDPESTRYFLRRNKIEILTALFAVAGYTASYYLVEQPQHSFFLNIAISLIAMLFFIYSKTRERDFYFISLRRSKDKEDWIGEGTFQYERTQNAYTITNSGSGFIFPKCLIWSDYKLRFDFKIIKISLGVILRATNLSNLVMLQIFDTGIKAHIRINGFWQAWDPKETHLEFKEKLNLDDWYTSSMQCDKSSIRIRIFKWVEHANQDNPSETSLQPEPIFDRVWKIPSGSMSYMWKREEINEPEAIVPFPINLEYGTVGFRNDGAENALVKDVLIEKI